MSKEQKKHMGIAVACNLIWGLAPIYWARLSHLDAVLVLFCRILFSALMAGLLTLQGRKRKQAAAILKDGRTMGFLAPAALAISFNWGLYIWAMGHGHMIDASLGYFLAPLIVFALSLLLFGERADGLRRLAMVIALVGVATTAFMYRSLPAIAFILGFTFTLYGALKKNIEVDPVVSILVENLLLAPFALVLLLVLRGDQLAALTGGDWLLLAGTGILTAVPMMLYTSSINNLSYITLGFLQYIAPVLIMLIGLFYGEVFSQEKALLLTFILAALILFTAANIREARQTNKEV